MPSFIPTGKAVSENKMFEKLITIDNSRHRWMTMTDGDGHKVMTIAHMALRPNFAKILFLHLCEKKNQAPFRSEENGLA